MTLSPLLSRNPVRDPNDCEHAHSELIDDSALIEFLQAGCEKCFEVLFVRYWKLAFAISWKILRQQTEAEDVVQDVFLAIYVQRDKYDSTRGSVKTWIAQFAHFKALMRRKYLQAREVGSLDDFSSFQSALTRVSTIQGVLERSALVEKYLTTLNPRQRRTIELIHFDGYTLVETAAVLQESLANTKNLYYRGMKTLRSQLTDSDPHARENNNDESPARSAPGSAGGPLVVGRPCRP
jgi:RNA polymerase sigma-70 factor (ECF subfamily)